MSYYLAGQKTDEKRRFETEIKGVPFLFEQTEEKVFKAYDSHLRLEINSDESYKYIYLSGMVTRSGRCAEWWGQNEARYTSSNRVFIGDKLADIFIIYTDGTADIVPFVFGVNVWNYDLFCNSSFEEPHIERWGGPFREPFDSDAGARELLENSLILNENFAENTLKANKYMFAYELSDKKIERIDFRQTEARNAGVYITGVTLGNEKPEGVKAAKNDFFLNQGYLNQAEKLARRLYQFADEIPGKVEHEVPNDYSAPVVDFYGSPVADILSNVYKFNMHDMAKEKITPDGRPHTSSKNAPSFGSYIGFGTFKKEYGAYYGDIWTRDIGRVLIELAKTGQNERLLESAKVMHELLYCSLPRFPQPNWKRVANCYEKDEDFKNSLQGKENDGHASIMQFIYQLFATGAVDKAWCEENKQAIVDAAEWFVWQIENPKESNFNKVLYSESEASVQHVGGYDLFSNAMAYYALLGYVEIAKKSGWNEKAESWKNNADILRKGIVDVFGYDHYKHGLILSQEYYDCWTYNYQRFAPLYVMSDFNGYDPELADPEWTEIVRNSYRHQKDDYFNPFSGRQMGYGQGYLTETAIMLDEYEDFTECIKASAYFSYHNEDKLNYIVPEGVIMHPSERYWIRNSDLGNGIQQGEIVKSIRLLLGLDDLNPDKGLRFVPRMPLDFTDMVAKKVDICIEKDGKREMVPVKYSYKRLTDGYNLKFSSDVPAKVNSLRIGPFDKGTVDFNISSKGLKFDNHYVREVNGRVFVEFSSGELNNSKEFNEVNELDLTVLSK